MFNFPFCNVILLGQMEKKEDLDVDIVKDMVLTKKQLDKEYPDKTLPGYIRELQVIPAKVTLYGFPQMEVLQMLQRIGPVSLLLDATGEY